MLGMLFCTLAEDEDVVKVDNNKAGVKVDNNKLVLGLGP